MKNVFGVYFSPTGGTEQVVQTVTEAAAEALTGQQRGRVQYIDLTLPAARQQDYEFGPEDLVVVGSPTYAGRVPNKIMPDLKARLHGQNTPAVAVSVFGNRSFDEALRELIYILEENGFVVVGAAAAAVRHAFSHKLAAGRPDEEDRALLRGFGARVGARVAEGKAGPVSIDRSQEVGPYYVPKKMDGSPARFLPAKPKVEEEKCSRCGLCAKVCPMGSIDAADVREVPGICIKCQACIRKCPEGARYFDDPAFLSHVEMLESNFMDRREYLFIEE